MLLLLLINLAFAQTSEPSIIERMDAVKSPKKCEETLEKYAKAVQTRDMKITELQTEIYRLQAESYRRK